MKQEEEEREGNCDAPDWFLWSRFTRGADDVHPDAPCLGATQGARAGMNRKRK